MLPRAWLEAVHNRIFDQNPSQNARGPQPYAPRVALLDTEATADYVAGQGPEYYCQGHGIEILDGDTVGGIPEEGVSVALSHNDLKRTVVCDSVVLAYPVSPDASLVEAPRPGLRGPCNR